MPKMGIIMPKMGMKPKSGPAKGPTSLADALFSQTQQRLLAYLFGQPERSFFANELIKLAGGGSGGVQRELARLEDSGLVRVARVGTQKHYQANPESPIFAELCGIAQKTVGLAEPLREGLAPLAKRIKAAFVFGSVAKRSDTATSDIDVLVLSDNVEYADLYPVLQAAETKLGRTVNPTVYTVANWRNKRKEGSSFVSKIAAQPKIFLIGGEEDIA